MKTSLLCALALLILPATLWAGPGDYHEERMRKKIAPNRLTCPASSSLVIFEHDDSIVESCMTAAGIRHGYFLKWAQNGASWATLGRFSHGRPVGVWIEFDANGERRRQKRYKGSRARSR